MPQESQGPPCDDSSAARPASIGQGRIDWLKDLPLEERVQSKPLQRLQSAALVLRESPSREQRQKVQKLLADWQVGQKNGGRKRTHNEVIKELSAKVAEEEYRLKRMQHRFEATSGEALAGRDHFSAIRDSLQHGSTEH